MALDSNEVRVAVTGAVAVGPVGITGPTSADGAVAGTFDLGYVADDGVTESRDRSTTKIKGWQNADTLREVVTDASMSYKFKLVQTNARTVGLFYGTEVDPTTGAVIIVPSKTGGRQSFLVDVIDDDQFIRSWIPNGEVTEVGDQVYASGEPIGYEITITCYPDDSIQTVDGQPGSVEKFYSSLAGASNVPTLVSALPSAAVATHLVTIKGQFFTGATTVKFGAVNATDFTVIDDATISAEMPAGSAGSAPVTVINAHGTSTGLAYTRGA